MSVRLIRNRLGGIDSELESIVENKVQESITVLQQINPRSIIEVPIITYDLRGTTAGQAVAGNRIRLNLGFLSDPSLREDMIAQTVPHEVCHIVAPRFYLYPKPHGREWKFLMRTLGLEPKRCHSYDTTNHVARKHPRPHRYLCPTCGQEWKLTMQYQPSGDKSVRLSLR